MINVSTIAAADWDRFHRDFPRAAAFLLDASLAGERRVLARAAHRTAWQEARYRALCALDAATRPPSPLEEA
jgi:hypothetical protein